VIFHTSLFLKSFSADTNVMGIARIECISIASPSDRVSCCQSEGSGN